MGPDETNELKTNKIRRVINQKRGERRERGGREKSKQIFEREKGHRGTALAMRANERLQAESGVEEGEGGGGSKETDSFNLDRCSGAAATTASRSALASGCLLFPFPTSTSIPHSPLKLLGLQNQRRNERRIRDHSLLQ